jgi:RimJ/RimL family protein N-acetyltransferase
VSLASEYAFKKLRLHKLVAGCYAPNAGSARAFEKAGFEKEGIRKKMFLFKGEYVDDLLFGKLNE